MNRLLILPDPEVVGEFVTIVLTPGNAMLGEEVTAFADRRDESGRRRHVHCGCR